MYLFADCLLLAKSTKDTGKFKLKVAWMLSAVNVELQLEGEGVEKSSLSKSSTSLQTSQNTGEGRSVDSVTRSNDQNGDATDASAAAELLVLKHTEGGGQCVLRLQGQPGAARSVQGDVMRLKEGDVTRNLLALGPRGC